MSLSGIILDGDVGEVISQNCPISPFIKLREKWFYIGIYRKNIPKDYHFSSKLQNMVKTSPCFKFVGLPLTVVKSESSCLILFDYNVHKCSYVLEKCMIIKTGVYKRHMHSLNRSLTF